MTINEAIDTAFSEIEERHEFTLYVAHKDDTETMKIGMSRRTDISLRTREYIPNPSDEELRGPWSSIPIARFPHLERAEYAEALLRHSALSIGAVRYKRKRDYFQNITKRSLIIAARRISERLNAAPG